MAPIKVFVDADCLHKLYLRKLLFTLDTQGIIELLWTNQVFDEALSSLISRFPQKADSLGSMFAGYREHFSGTEVTGYQHLLGTLNCSDPDDEQVLAGALTGKADFLLTYNLKDFPSESNRLGKPIIVHPDLFLFELLSEEGRSTALFVDWLCLFNNPVGHAIGGAEALERTGCLLTASLLRETRLEIDSQLLSRGRDAQ